MKYRAEFNELKNQFDINFLQDDGTIADYVGSAPTKVAARALVTEHVRKRKAVAKAIEFDDNGVITRDDTT